ncbi:MAG: hypothetical protein HY595_05720 [Candidatus Omnitrophica bacterium]|nr:hypothetical protein [Candidatus Omnitrophota bacterium]
MTKQELLKDTEFQEVTEARVDAKHRVALGKSLSGPIASFRVYRNAHGQIMLDPLILIPAHEAWLFNNRRATDLVRKGLDDARRGRLVKAKEDYSKYVRGNE